MIDTKNISNHTLEKDKKNEKKSKMNHQVMEQLGYFGKRRLSRYNELIFKIINTIKKTSYWDYTYPSTFTFLSDFSFNPETKQITYTINKVTANEEGYHLSEDPTEREIDFFYKYNEFLTKLFALEQKRQAIYDKHTEVAHDNVIPFNSIVSRNTIIKENQDKNFIIGFTNFQMDNFIIKYHSEGIRRLIKLLNDLTNSLDPYSVYNELRAELSSDYIEELLRWASLYTPVAQRIIDQIALERMNKHYEISGFPSYEERMTDNITKLL